MINVEAKQKPGRMLLGGRHDYDLTLEENQRKINDLVEYGLSKLAEQRVSAAAAESNSISSSKLKYENLETMRVQTQIVAGINYFIKLRIKEANCTADCDTESCELRIWEKPWENFRNLTHVECKTKVEQVGGKKKISTSNKEALNALHFAVMKMNQESNDLFYSRPLKVDKVHKQVVNGIKYVVIFKYAQTECSKNDPQKKVFLNHLDLAQCQIKQQNSNYKTLKCKVVVLDKPWLNENGQKFEESSTSRYKIMNQDCQQNDD